jgi:hypothetical protein
MEKGRIVMCSRNRQSIFFNRYSGSIASGWINMWCYLQGNPSGWNL